MIVTVTGVVSVAIPVLVPMIVPLIVPLGSADAIRAALGIKGRLLRQKPAAETLDQLLDDVVAADAQAPAEELRRQMSVAEVPGDPHQFGRPPGRDVDDAFRRGTDLHDAAIVEQEAVAMAQRDRLGQVEEEVEPAVGPHRDAAAVAGVIVEEDEVSGACRLARKNCHRADHGQKRK